MISAGVLTLLQNVHTNDLIRPVLLLFMTLFSAFGFLTSLRLKAELEECLDKIGVMTTAAKLSEFVALGQLESRPWHYPKFRWFFPVFFAMTTAGFITLILYRFLRDRHRPNEIIATATPWINPSCGFVLRRTNLVRERALGFISSNHPG